MYFFKIQVRYAPFLICGISVGKVMILLLFHNNNNIIIILFFQLKIEIKLNLYYLPSSNLHILHIKSEILIKIRSVDNSYPDRI